jgi:broad specificity phosphatase PhoE
MKWVIFRHGEKQNSGFDPELTAQGHRQAGRILSRIQEGKLPKPNALYVSTKKRTAQTFDPLSQHFKLKAQIRAELTERVTGESKEKFRFRIQEFLVRLLLQHPDQDVIYLCTHFDWIEEFMSIIEGDQDLSRLSTFSSGQFIFFDKKELWHVVKCETL